jgi:hypothetical protein
MIPYSCIVRVLAHRVPKVLRVVTIPGFPTQKNLDSRSIFFFKFKHENVLIMKNKPDLAHLGPPNLSNEIQKRLLKSCETIPLSKYLRVRIHKHTV